MREGKKSINCSNRKMGNVKRFCTKDKKMAMNDEYQTSHGD